MGTRKVLGPRRPRLLALAALAALVGLAPACATYRDQLGRSQQAFEQSQYERTLGLLRALEPDVPRLTMAERAHYTYLRGMADYRMGVRSDARHWLSLARAYEERSPGTLPADWKARMTDALEELNGVVYDEGMAALQITRKPGEDAPDAKKK